MTGIRAKLGFLAALVFVATTASAELVGLWLLDEGDGDEAIDISGNGFDGAIEGDYEWTEGQFGQALDFTSGRVRVDHDDALDFEEWTISVWVNIGAATATYQMVAGKEQWPDRNYSMWVLPTTMTFGFTSGADDIQVQSGDVVNSEWRHLVGTYDGDFLRGYVDGELGGERGAAGTPNTCACPFFIGSQPPNGGGPMIGAIDEVSIYNHAVDEDEVLEIFAGLTPLAVRANGKASVAWAELKGAVE